MSASGSRASDDINLEEFERRLRAAGAQQANIEDPLTELARLVESADASGQTSVRPVSQADRGKVESARSIETEALRPAIYETEDLIPAASEADRAARQDYEVDAPRPYDAHAAGEASDRQPRRWKLAVSALAIAGLAMIGAVFALRGGVPGLPKQPPFIAAAQGPTRVQPPSDETVAPTHEAGASLLKDNSKPASVKVVDSEEQPVDLSAQQSPGSPPAAPANAPVAATSDPAPAPGYPPGLSQLKTVSDAAGATPVAATINTPLVPPAAAQPPAVTSEFPDPKPVRTVSLRPDGTPIVSSNPPAQSAGVAPPAAAPTPPPPVPAAPKAATDAAPAAVAEASTPKLELPTKLSPKSSARVAVAKTDTTAPDAAAQTPNAPAAQPGAQAKPAEKTPKKPKGEQATTEAATTPVAAPTTSAAAAEPPVDATAATVSSGWSVQLAAPRSEAEAKSEMSRLTSKYSAELNGSAIGVHKAQVNGETIYRLRVVGLTKADAAALCARLKGEGAACFIAR